jgi:dolichyl-phosphate beta-glucosyltransferase
VVVPAYNEERRIGESLAKMRSYLNGAGCDYEIIVVDDGSTDSTSDVVRRVAARDSGVRLVSNRKNRGKGYTVRRGMEEAKGETILFSDADLSTPIEEFDRLSAYLDDYDLVIASRSLPDSRVLVHQPFYRELMGRLFNVLVQVLLVRGIIDTQCGFKIMNRRAADRITGLLRIDSFSFDVEMILAARRQGLGVKDVPVRWINSPGSRVHPVRDSAQMMLDLLRIKLYDLLGYYRNEE